MEHVRSVVFWKDLVAKVFEKVCDGHADRGRVFRVFRVCLLFIVCVYPHPRGF